MRQVQQKAFLLHIQVIALQADVRDAASIKQAADSCEELIGLPHIVVNNAAGNFISPTERLSPNAFKTIVDIVVLERLMSVWNLVKD